MTRTFNTLTPIPLRYPNILDQIGQATLMPNRGGERLDRSRDPRRRWRLGRSLDPPGPHPPDPEFASGSPEDPQLQLNPILVKNARSGTVGNLAPRPSRGPPGILGGRPPL